MMYEDDPNTRLPEEESAEQNVENRKNPEFWRIMLASGLSVVIIILALDVSGRASENKELLVQHGETLVGIISDAIENTNATATAAASEVTASLEPITVANYRPERPRVLRNINVLLTQVNSSVPEHLTIESISRSSDLDTLVATLNISPSQQRIYVASMRQNAEGNMVLNQLRPFLPSEIELQDITFNPNFPPVSGDGKYFAFSATRTNPQTGMPESLFLIMDGSKRIIFEKKLPTTTIPVTAQWSSTNESVFLALPNEEGNTEVIFFNLRDQEETLLQSIEDTPLVFATLDQRVIVAEVDNGTIISASSFPLLNPVSPESINPHDVQGLLNEVSLEHGEFGAAIFDSRNDSE